MVNFLPQGKEDTQDDLRSKANCNLAASRGDTELFFGLDEDDRPEGLTDHQWAGKVRTTNANFALTAKIRYCHECPVKTKCATVGWHLDYGIYGGLTPPERRAIDAGVVPAQRTRSNAPPGSGRKRVVDSIREGYSVEETAWRFGLNVKSVRAHLASFLESGYQ